MPKENVGRKVEQCYLEYARYINSIRALPDIRDGFKGVQRRLVMVGNKNKSKFVKSATIVGECIGKHHPHGDTSTYGALVTLVNSPNALFTGQGGWGGMGTGASAYRYTEAKITDLALKLYCSFINEVNQIENDLNYMEPEYLPTPIPYALIATTFGMGIGVSTKMLPFELKSMLKWVNWYYNGGKREPRLKLHNTVFHTEADMDGILNKGIGQVSYSPNLVESYVDGKLVVNIISNDRSMDLFPFVKKLFYREYLEKLVFINNESTNINDIAVGRNSYIKRITDDEIRVRLRGLTRNFTYRGYWYDNGVARIVPVKEVLKRACDDFHEKFKDSVKHKLEKIEDELTYERIKLHFTQMKINKDPKALIMKNLGIEKRIYDLAMTKSLASLDTDRIDQHNKTKFELESKKPTDLI